MRKRFSAFEALLNRQNEVKEARTEIENTDEKMFDEISELFKLLKNPSLAYRKSVAITNQRGLVISMVASLELNGKVLIVNWKKPIILHSIGCLTITREYLN